MSVSLLAPDVLCRDLGLRDLSDPSHGGHAIQLIVADVTDALARVWACDVRVVRRRPIVALEDNYDRLRYPPDAIARDVRYTRYVSETCVLRSHTSAVIPSALRALAREEPPPEDVVLACPGIVYRRDSIDRLHTGTPHQLDLWRVAAEVVDRADLDEMIDTVVNAALPGAAWKSEPADHPYTLDGREVQARPAGATEWVEIGECGLAHPEVLASAGIARRTGLAMGVGLDRLLMMRKGIPDIRLLRSADPRVIEQMDDLAPYRAVSAQPAVRRDLSVALAEHELADDEALGDRVRDALGDDADAVEEVAVLSDTPGHQLPATAAARLGLRPGQRNLLVRVVLRRVDRSLTDDEANVLRDRIYERLHEGDRDQWAAR